MKETEKSWVEELSGADKIFITRCIKALARKYFGESTMNISDDQLDFVIRAAYHIGVFPEGIELREVMKNDANWPQN